MQLPDVRPHPDNYSVARRTPRPNSRGVRVPAHMTAFLVNDDRVELPVGYFLSDDELSDLIARLGACGFDVAEACSMISACVAAVGATPAERARAVVAWRERLADGRPPVRGWYFTREAYAQRSGA